MVLATTIRTCFPRWARVSPSASMEPRPSPSGRMCVVSKKLCLLLTNSTNGDQSIGMNTPWTDGTASALQNRDYRGQIQNEKAMQPGAAHALRMRGETD